MDAEYESDESDSVALADVKGTEPAERMVVVKKILEMLNDVGVIAVVATEYVGASLVPVVSEGPGAEPDEVVLKIAMALVETTEDIVKVPPDVSEGMVPVDEPFADVLPPMGGGPLKE